MIKENNVLINKKLFSLQNLKIFCLLVDFYNSRKYAKFQRRSPDKITKYTALYLEKWSFCWRQQFSRVTQKPRVDVSKSHASRKNKLQSNKASRMVTQAYRNLARVYVDSCHDSCSCEKKCEVLYRATLKLSVRKKNPKTGSSDARGIYSNKN